MPNFDEPYANDALSFFAKEHGFALFTQEQKIEILKGLSPPWSA